MSRYIDADALIEGIANKFYDEASTAEAFDMVNKVCDYITDAPSIDIVRCKECKYAHMTYGGDCKDCDMWKDNDDFYIELYLDGDFYCAYGERKESE